MSDTKTITKQECESIVCDFINSILQKLGYNCSANIAESDEKILIDINGEDSKELLKRRGEILDSLQYLSLLVLNKKGANDFKVVIDSSNFRESRELFLRKLAKRTAREVATTNKAISLDPMNGFERRIIHLALQDDKFVKTESEGDEPNRYIIILPKNQSKEELYDSQSKQDFRRNGLGRKKSFGKTKRSLL